MKLLEKELLTIYLLIDLFVLNGCLLLLNWLRLDVYFSDPHQLIIYFIHLNASWIFAYLAFGKLNIYLRDGFRNRIWRISKRLMIYIAIASISAFLFLPKYYSRHFFLEHTVLFYFGTIASYFFIYKYLKFKRKRGFNTTRVVIVANCEMAIVLRKIINNNPMLGYKFLGYVVHDNTPDQQEVLGLTANIEQLIAEYRIEMIISIQNAANQAFNNSINASCDKYGVRLRFVPENNLFYKAGHNAETVAGIALINPHVIPLDDLGSRIKKRLFDIFFSIGIILFLFSWLFPIIAIIIKLSSKGPVFFTQKRTGLNNRTFTCIKFRSMNLNCISDTVQATANDARITLTGQFLRKYNLDELPQFLNVLMGNMSVAGPRPHMLKHTEQYSKLVKHYLIRHYVKPGITGWAQVNGYRGETDELWKMEERVKYDMDYIENWTLSLDIKIVFMTLFGKNSLKNAG